MNERDSDNSMDRRTFIKLAATTAIGGSALFSSACAETQTVKKRDAVTGQAEKLLMTYKKLGRTNFSGRLRWISRKRYYCKSKKNGI